MLTKTNNKHFRYLVKISSNDVTLPPKIFEGTSTNLHKVCQDCFDYIKEQMFSSEGTFYFHRSLNIILQEKSRDQTWDDAKSIKIYDPSLDIESHLLNWEEELICFIEPVNTTTVIMKNEIYTFSQKNVLLLQVINELAEV